MKTWTLGWQEARGAMSEIFADGATDIPMYESIEVVELEPVLDLLEHLSAVPDEDWERTVASHHALLTAHGRVP